MKWPLALIVALGLPTPALAHHAMGGTLPDTWSAGLLSGLGHPVIGLDHLAFVVAVGLVAAFGRGRYLTPLAFVATTLAGCALYLAGAALPQAELVIAASVALLGGLAASGRTIPVSARLAVFALAGLFHGWAYGGSIVGAEPTPLVAYLEGFVLMQYAIAAAVVWLCAARWHIETPGAVAPRLAGAVACGIGVAFLAERLEGLVFA